jgi:hypothetical protein
MRLILWNTDLWYIKDNQWHQANFKSENLGCICKILFGSSQHIFEYNVFISSFNNLRVGSLNIA